MNIKNVTNTLAICIVSLKKIEVADTIRTILKPDKNIGKDNNKA